jgi:heat shock protein HspQ
MVFNPFYPPWRQPPSWSISHTMAKARTAKFQIGQIVRHRVYPFRGVIFDIDPEFANTDEWYESIPEDRRPRKDQPFYHLFAENAESEYIAYVSEQNLLPDESGEPVRHPQVAEVFEKDESGSYRRRNAVLN